MHRLLTTLLQRLNVMQTHDIFRRASRFLDLKIHRGFNKDVMLTSHKVRFENGTAAKDIIMFHNGMSPNLNTLFSLGLVVEKLWMLKVAAMKGTYRAELASLSEDPDWRRLAPGWNSAWNSRFHTLEFFKKYKTVFVIKKSDTDSLSTMMEDEVNNIFSQFIGEETDPEFVVNMIESGKHAKDHQLRRDVIHRDGLWMTKDMQMWEALLSQKQSRAPRVEATDVPSALSHDIEEDAGNRAPQFFPLREASPDREFGSLELSPCVIILVEHMIRHPLSWLVTMLVKFGFEPIIIPKASSMNTGAVLHFKDFLFSSDMYEETVKEWNAIDADVKTTASQYKNAFMRADTATLESLASEIYKRDQQGKQGMFSLKWKSEVVIFDEGGYFAGACMNELNRILGQPKYGGQLKVAQVVEQTENGAQKHEAAHVPKLMASPPLTGETPATTEQHELLSQTYTFQQGTLGTTHWKSPNTSITLEITESSTDEVRCTFMDVRNNKIWEGLGSDQLGKKDVKCFLKHVDLPCCQVSTVARSVIKDREDANVGPECVLALEFRLRMEYGLSLALFARHGPVLIIGLGKIGVGAARAFLAYGCHVVVAEFDKTRVHDFHNHFSGVDIIQERLTADPPEPGSRLHDVLSKARVIFSATGRNPLRRVHLQLCQPNTAILTCTSFDDELHEELWTEMNLV